MGYARETGLPCGCRAKCSVQIVEVALPFFSTCLTVERLLVGHDIGVIDAGKKLPIFSDQAGHDLEMKQPVRRVMQLATLKTANGSPGISRHRSYTRQTKEVKNFANFVFQFRRK